VALKVTELFIILPTVLESYLLVGIKSMKYHSCLDGNLLVAVVIYILEIIQLSNPRYKWIRPSKT